MIKNCQNCGATLSLDSYQDTLLCHYCDTVHVPSLREDSAIEKIDGVLAGSSCSLCLKKFSLAKLGEVSFLYCESCKGLLVDQSDLLNLILYVRSSHGKGERFPVSIRQEDLERIVNCPSCREKMHTHEYYGPGDFVVDSCSSCKKVWLDGGELSQAATVRWGGSLWS